MRRGLVVAGAAVAAGVLAGAAIVVWTTPPGAPGPDRPPRDRAQRVLVLSIPTVTWEVLNDTDVPNLNRLLDESAVADLATRTLVRVSRLGDGYVTLGAGTRSVGAGPTDGEALATTERFGADEAGDVFQRRTGRRPGRGIVHLGIAAIVEENEAELYDAEVGALGSALDAAGYSRAVIANADGLDLRRRDIGFYRRQAVGALMDADGRLPAGRVDDRLLESHPAAPFGVRYDTGAVVDAFRQVWRPKSVVLVEASDLVRADAYRQVATAEERGRILRAALRHTDALVGSLLEEVDPRRDAVLVVGTAHAQRETRLTVAALRAPGFEPGLLRSGATRRSGFVQLTDVAPTVLDRLGIEPPDSMEGRPFELGRVGGSAAARRDFLADGDRATVFRDGLVTEVAAGFVVIQGALMAGLLATGRWRVPWVRSVVRVASLAALAYVPAVYLARLVPLFEVGIVAFWAFVGVVLLGLGLLWDRAGPGIDPVLVALGAIVGLLALDVLLGAPLEFNSALGYSPKVAGRFAGYGNLGYAANAAAAVLLAGLVAHRVGGRRGAQAAIALLAAVVVIDGLPFWGSDVGGALSMVPAFAITATLLLGRRVRARTVAACVLGALTTVGVFGLLDLARPTSRRTHLGRLFERVADDGWSSLATVLQRKAVANLSVLDSVWVLMVLLVLGFYGYLWLRARDRLQSLTARIPELRPALVGLAIVAVLGFALNDSGIAVPGTMLGVLNAVVVGLLLRVEAEAPRVEREAPVPRAQPEIAGTPA